MMDGGSGGDSPKVGQIDDREHSLRYYEDGIPKKPPWLNKAGEVIWSRPRIMVAQVIDAQAFETFMAVIVISNICLIIFETDLEARCYPHYFDRVSECPDTEAKSHPWVSLLNMGLLVLYTVEASLRVYVERHAYVVNHWNLLDLVIVSVGWLGQVLGSVLNLAFLRFFRVARLARALRVFLAFRELYLLLVGFLSAIKAIFWGGIMMFGMLLLWAILMVEFVHPVNSRLDYGDCERCGRGLETVMAAVLTLFQQIVVGDSWGALSIPIIEEAPWAGFIIVGAAMTVSFGLSNLILSVIVDQAAEARERDVQEKLNQKKMAEEEQRKHLLEICQRMDDDHSGTLDVKELLAGYDKHEDFRSTLQMMDIQREELKAVFKVLDKNHSGDVDYAEFCDQLNQMKTRDTRTMLTFLKLSVTEVKEDFEGLQASQEELKEMLSPLSQAVQDQSSVIAAINDRLNKMDIDGALTRLAAGEEKLKTSNSEKERLLMPVVTPQPWLPPDRPLSTDVIVGDIQGLSHSTQEVASIKGLIVKRLEEHVATLTRQAGMLASIGVSVQSGGWQPEPAQGFPDSAQVRIAEKLNRLQQNMQQNLVAMLREVDVKLEDGAATLARNTELLACLSRDLGVERQLEQMQQPELPPRPKRGSFDGPAEALPDDNVARSKSVNSAGGQPFFSCSTVGRAPTVREGTNAKSGRPRANTTS